MSEKLYRIKPLNWRFSGGVWYTSTVVGNFSVCDTTNRINRATWAVNEYRSCDSGEDGREKVWGWFLEILSEHLEPESIQPKQ